MGRAIIGTALLATVLCGTFLLGIAQHLADDDTWPEQ